MLSKNLTFFIAVYLTVFVVAACGKKDDPNAPVQGQSAPAPSTNGIPNPNTPGSIPPPRAVPKVSPQGAQPAYDNSFVAPTVVLRDVLMNRSFSLTNYNSAKNGVPTGKKEGNQVVAVNPYKLTFLSFENRAQTDEAAEFVFNFDSSGRLSFKGRLDQMDYNAINIPYDYSREKGYLLIGEFFANAVQRFADKSRPDVLHIQPISHKEKLEWPVLNTKISAFGGDTFSVRETAKHTDSKVLPLENSDTGVLIYQELVIALMSYSQNTQNNNNSNSTAEKPAGSQAEPLDWFNTRLVLGVSKLVPN